ncbi:hypothetical protein AV656_02970 [Bhargavaea cecembensis]|uniref:Uncharacterized protein n=1 Tax=Bhargavaea cecembensis TaxID=394098 RepID=A0A165HJX9_9BACL|nr:hypothetical protein [Bhargavaea cecembensis]KZE40244.1 hypothetical protein AV656_02970 [Bhargavaea cecembensis]
MLDKLFEILQVARKPLKHAVLFLATYELLVAILPAKYNGLIAGFGAWALIVYLAIGGLWGASKVSAITEKRTLENDYGNKHKNLYYWLSDPDWEKSTIYGWLKEEKDISLTENLVSIKKTIIKNVGEDINDYYLLKGYLEFHAKNNILNNFQKVIGVIILGGISGFVTQIGILENLFNFSVVKQPNSIEVVENIIQVASVTLIFTVTFLSIKHEFTKDKRKMDLLITIVNVIIKEREVENKN